jgi:hypothetical protein
MSASTSSETLAQMASPVVQRAALGTARIGDRDPVTDQRLEDERLQVGERLQLLPNLF